MQTCNIFGGEDSCKQLPADSQFGKSCGKEREDLFVDCIFYSDSEKSMDLDPRDSLADALGSDYAKIKGHCPECLNNMQALVRHKSTSRTLLIDDCCAARCALCEAMLRSQSRAQQFCTGTMCWQ